MIKLLILYPKLIFYQYIFMNEIANIKKMQDIRIFHIGIGILLFLQGVLILLLSSGFNLPITTSYLQKNLEAGILAPTISELFRIQVAYLIVLFLLIAGLNHLIVALPVVFSKYIKFIARNSNPFRWIEYSLTAPIMIIILSLLTGIFDFSTLILLFVTTISMILFGSLMESINGGRRKTNWLPFIYASLAGLTPWIIIWLSISGARGIQLIPPYIIFSFFTLMIFFALFPVNLFLHYKKIGPWKNYEFVETMFILLSLVSKSALAWQIFLGLLG